MAQRVSGVKVSVGFASETGPRKRNEDFGGAVFGPELPEPRRDVVAAVADGIGSAKGGRQASEIAVRGFLDGFCDLPETMEVRRAAAIVLDSLNGWIHSQGARDPELAGMGCTFTALVLRGRTAHVLHVGDTRAYRFSRDRLSLLTADHVRPGGNGRSNILTRALGVETEVRLDYTTQPVAQHDRFLLCSDGVHGTLTQEVIAEIMRERVSSEDTARALAAAALDAGSTDNCTALVLDVVGLETAQSADIGASIAQLPLLPLPQGGETIDGFVLKVLLSDGRYTRLFGAEDEIEGGEVALKFPKPQLASVEKYREAFVLLEATLDGTPINYCPYIFVDNDAAMARGWAQGFPKKLGSIYQTRSFSAPSPAAAPLAKGSRFGASVAAHGERLATARIQLEDRVSDPATVFNRPTVMRRYFPQLAAAGQHKPPVDELTMSLTDNLAIVDVWAGSAELRMPEVQGEDMHLIAPLRVGRGYRLGMAYSVTDLRILKNYVA